MRQHFLSKVISIMLTVAMLASFVPASLVSAATPSQFTDFPTGWSKPAMTAAVNNGLLQGKTDTTIEPQSYLTRAEMATIINRAFGAYLKTDITNYTDVQKSSWYYDEMAIAVNMQTFEGNGSDKLYPENNITREEVFAVVARALVYDTKDYSSLSRFNDGASVSDWAKPYVSALAARGYINGDETGNLYPKAYITREEFAQIMHNIIKTYISAPGDYNKVAEGGVMIRSQGVHLKDVNISGDLVIGDGVGYNNLEISNVDVAGRMIVRAGNITLKETTTGMKIAVKNVNGVVHFNNYSTEKVFEGIDERTHTTYLTTSGGVSFGGGGGGGGGGGSTTPTMYKYTVKYYFQKADLSDSYEIDETLTKSATVEKRTQVTAQTPAIEGFTLNNDKSAAAFNAVIYQNDQVLKVYYDRDFYTLTFNYNYQGAPVASTVKTAKGYSLGEFNKMPAVANRESHTFAGWSTDASATTPNFTGNTVATADGTLYAVWEIKKFDLTFKYDDGVTADSLVQDVEWGTEFGTIKPATDPTRADYYFGGWYTEPDGQGDRYNDDTPIGADASIYAYWTPIPTYTVTFKYEDDGITADFEANDVPENTLFGTIKPTDPTREDYDFQGWFAQPDGQGEEYEDDTPVMADTVVYAYWTLKPIVPVTYTVTFKYNYINAPQDDAVNGISYNTLFGSIITDEIRNKIVNRVENGATYGFVGWNTSPDGNGAWYTDTKKITRNITLYAMWEELIAPTTYTVTFNFNYKATWANADVAGIAYGAEFATAKAQVQSTLDGYIAEVVGEKVFKGWNTKADGTGAMYADDAKITGDIELFAIWADALAPTTYTVTFNYNYKPEWVDALAQNVVYGTEFKNAIPSQVSLNIETYKTELLNVKAFKGWNTKSDGTGTMYGENTKITDNITLYAIWADIDVATTYTVTFDYNYNPLWTAHDEIGVVYGSAFKDVIPNKVIVDLDTYRNELLNIKAFKGWNTKPDGTGAMYVDTTAIKGNTTLYAIWADIDLATTYTVTFDYNYDVSWADGLAENVVYGSDFKDIIPQEVADALAVYKTQLDGVKEFRGWNNLEDGTGTMYTDATKITGNTVLYAIWADALAPTTYTVTLKYNHNHTDSTPDYVKGEIVYGTALGSIIIQDVLDNLVSHDVNGVTMCFKGWNTKADGTGIWYEDTTKITKDLVLYAVWEEEAVATKYVVTFDFNEKPEWPDDEATDIIYGTAFKDIIPASVTTALDGYILELTNEKEFKGWNTKADGTGVWYKDDTRITDDVTLYAIWETIVKYTVTFKYNYTGAPDDALKEKILFGTLIKNIVTDDIKANIVDRTEGELLFGFKGWNTKKDGTGTWYEDETPVTADVVLYAIWYDKSTYYTVKFYYGYAQTDEYKEYIKVSEEDDVLAGSTYEQGVVTQMYIDAGYDEDMYLMQDGYYDAEFNSYHKIPGQLRYLDGTQWREFKTDDPSTPDVDEGTPITGNMEIHYTFANLGLFGEVNAFGINQSVTLTVPYSNSTRLMDTLKDFLWINRNAIENALVLSGLEQRVLDKAEEKGGKFIDANGNIKVVDFDLLISRVIAPEDIDKKAKEYLERIIRTGTQAEIENMLGMVNVDSFIKSIGLKKLIAIVGYDAVKDELVKPAVRAQLLAFIRDLIENDGEFRNIVIDKFVTDKVLAKSYLDTELAKQSVVKELTTNDDLLVDLMSNDDFRLELITTMSTDNKFISALLTSSSLQRTVLNLIRTTEKDRFIEMLNKPSHALAHSLINDLKGDGTSIPEIILHDLTNIIEEVKNTSNFKSILTTPGITRDDIISELLSTITFDPALHVTEQQKKDYIVELLEKYANDREQLKLDDFDTFTKVDTKATNEINNAVNNYFTNQTMNADLSNMIDAYVNDWIVDTITNYLNEADLSNPVNLTTALIADIEAEFIAYMEHYLNGNVTFEDDEASAFVASVKADFITAVKAEPVSSIKDPVVTYVTDTTHFNKVDSMVRDNYTIVEDFILNNLTTDPLVVTFVKDYANENIVTISSDDNTLNHYIDTYFDTFVDNEMIDKFVSKYENDDDVYALLSDIMDAETIAKYIVKTRNDDALNGTNNIQTLVDQAIDMLENLEYYKEFMECFKNGDATYHVDKDNILFVEAVGHGIYTFDFDELVDILREKGFGKLIDKIGMDKFEEIFNESKEEYYNGILDMKAQLEADETKEFEYKASMWVRIDPMDIVKSLFDEHKQKLYNKASTVDRVKYDENPYLKQFVEQDLFAEFFNYDASMKDDVYTGYSIKSFMDYYDIMYDRILLADKALCWYGELPADEHAELENLVMNGAVKAINKAIELINKLYNDEEIFRGYTVEELADKYNKTSELFDRFEDKYRKALDKFANSKFNRTYDRSYIESKYAPYNIADIVTGIDTENRFYVDSVYNMIGTRLDRFKLEYVENEYSGRYAIDKYGKDFRDNKFSISRYID